MIDIKKGDYFDVCQIGNSTKRVICISEIYNEKYCHAVDVNDLDSAGYINKIYIVDIENEVGEILGNVFN